MNNYQLQDDLLVKVTGLKTYFHMEQGVVRAVDDVSFQIPRGKSLGVVGESGCGKSVTAFSLMQLVQRPRGRIEEGEMLFRMDDGRIIDIAQQEPNGSMMRSVRGNNIAMIFQEPMTSLNPVYTIGQQIMEAVMLHQKKSSHEAKEIAIEMLDKVRIPGPRQRVDEYPHQFSGGMRQRAMIAMALSCNPMLLIADEPTTALDVTIEAQILELIKDLQDEIGMALMMITHDLGVIGEMADHTIVMYMGKVVETAPTAQVFETPHHPYTQALLRSVPEIGRKDRLASIRGSVPNPYLLPKGCPFAPRCDFAMDICREEFPPACQVNGNHEVSCWLHVERN